MADRNERLIAVQEPETYCEICGKQAELQEKGPLGERICAEREKQMSRSQRSVR